MKKELYNKFRELFLTQMGLELSEVLVLENDKFILKMDLLSISMASLSLKLSKDEHSDIAKFLELIRDDNLK